MAVTSLFRKKSHPNHEKDIIITFNNNTCTAPVPLEEDHQRPSITMKEIPSTLTSGTTIPSNVFKFNQSLESENEPESQSLTIHFITNPEAFHSQTKNIDFHLKRLSSQPKDTAMASFQTSSDLKGIYKIFLGHEWSYQCDVRAKEGVLKEKGDTNLISPVYWWSLVNRARNERGNLKVCVVYFNEENILAYVNGELGMEMLVFDAIEKRVKSIERADQLQILFFGGIADGVISAIELKLKELETTNWGRYTKFQLETEFVLISELFEVLLSRGSNSIESVLLSYFHGTKLSLEMMSDCERMVDGIQKRLNDGKDGAIQRFTYIHEKYNSYLKELATLQTALHAMLKVNHIIRFAIQFYFLCFIEPLNASTSLLHILAELGFNYAYERVLYRSRKYCIPPLLTFLSSYVFTKHRFPLWALLCLIIVTYSLLYQIILFHVITSLTLGTGLMQTLSMVQFIVEYRGWYLQAHRILNPYLGWLHRWNMATLLVKLFVAFMEGELDSGVQS